MSVLQTWVLFFNHIFNILLVLLVSVMYFDLKTKCTCPFGQPFGNLRMPEKQISCPGLRATQLRRRFFERKSLCCLSPLLSIKHWGVFVFTKIKIIHLDFKAVCRCLYLLFLVTQTKRKTNQRKMFYQNSAQKKENERKHDSASNDYYFFFFVSQWSD